MRWSMNQAVFWVTPIARWTAWEDTPFLQFTTCHMAINHFARGSGESSKMVPVLAVNWRLSWRALHRQSVVLLKKRDVLGAATRALDAIRPAARYDILPAVLRLGKIGDRLLKSVEYPFHIEMLAELG